MNHGLSYLGKMALVVCLCFAMGNSASAATSIKQKTTYGPFIPYTNEFASAIVLTPGTHETLYAFKPNQPRVAASLTKLANALAFMRLQIPATRVVSLLGVDEVGGGRLRVNSGAKMTVIDLVFSSITASANNTATAMARLSKLGTAGFLSRMNKEAKACGATQSKFFDASGMNPKNMTTAKDIALIAEKAFQDKTIHAAATSEIYEFKILNTGEQKKIKNTNQLLTNDPEVFIVGGKTGYLEESKNNLVVQLRPMLADGSGDRKKELIIAVMGAPTKDGMFATAKRLAQWAWENHEF